MQHDVSVGTTCVTRRSAAASSADTRPQSALVHLVSISMAMSLAIASGADRFRLEQLLDQQQPAGGRHGTIGRL